MTTLDEITPYLSQVGKHGRYLSACCPFHNDRNPSMLVYEDGFVCLSSGCGKRGTLDDLAKQLRRSDPVSATVDSKGRFVWSAVGNPQVFVHDAHQELLRNKGALAYYARRGIPARTVTRCQLGYHRGWFVIPVFAHGLTKRLSQVVVRSSPSIASMVRAKYETCPWFEPTLYVPDPALMEDGGRPVVLVFGMFDALYLTSLGFAACTPTHGDLSFKPEWMRPYRRRILVIPDRDALLRGAAIASRLDWRGENLQLDYPDGVKDPNGFYEANRERSLLRQLKEAVG